jgi:hypothetical protein
MPSSIDPRKDRRVHCLVAAMARITGLTEEASFESGAHTGPYARSGRKFDRSGRGHGGHNESPAATYRYPIRSALE